MCVILHFINTAQCLSIHHQLQCNLTRGLSDANDSCKNHHDKNCCQQTKCSPHVHAAVDNTSSCKHTEFEALPRPSVSSSSGKGWLSDHLGGPAVELASQHSHIQRYDATEKMMSRCTCPGREGNARHTDVPA